MEETRTIKRVGNYSTMQGNPEDCTRCGNAQYGTIIIDGLCLDCFEEKILEKQTLMRIIDLAILSLGPDGWNHLELALDELIKTRHIPIKDIDSLIAVMSYEVRTGRSIPRPGL